MTDNKLATFINGDRRVHYVEIPDNELDRFLAQLAAEVKRVEDEANTKPGFVNVQKDR